MSEEEDKADTSCASCGIAEIDDVKLKECDGCDLVQYCSDACQELHRPEHEEACKKRAAELRDELLFKQPESTHEGDCPICMLPLPQSKSCTHLCCSKVVCIGCEYAHQKRQFEQRLQLTCPFCREPVARTKEEQIEQLVKRVEANDPVAMRELGIEKRKKGDYSIAFEYLKKAAVLGDADAHYRLSYMYHGGQSVEKDKGKQIYHAEEAAIGGHSGARLNLGCVEWTNNSNAERSVKHMIIAATQGSDEAIKSLMNGYKDGLVDKEDLASVLRAHKAAVDATKSSQREEAEVYYRAMGLM